MYHYEALGDERFQHFCQSLLAASFPNIQCLPVGQPDGGRDAFLMHHALARRSSLSNPDVLVFQVKYIKNPMDSRTERDFIEQVVKLEKSKIEKLRSRGLQKYYLLTNLKGTAHLEVGSIDRVNDLLSSELGIEAYCWWRDDLDRRLDLNPNLKWSYPDVLKATDLLGKLVDGQLGEDQERRKSAVHAYLTDQYDDDEELKFKQTELRSTMTELFVDLPMRPSRDLFDADDAAKRHYYRARIEGSNHVYTPFGFEADHSASYFIKEMLNSGIDRAVLEGAPGQGKSTVTQYVCQVMRMQLLGKTDELNSLPDMHRHSQIRIPFRVDLRDLAKWLSGYDPFQSKIVQLDEKEPKSLEGLLAAQVRHSSGGHSFSVSDLAAVAKAGHMFLALDGFDEVADVELRKRLVDEISKGVNRLANFGNYSVQTIVTSRPAAFAKSVRFPREQWSYFELLPLERSQVDEYTTKWMKAKGLKESEQNQLRRLLDTKLKEAHTQYLAKNPMQLTILLSLMYNRGASLPEKRTAMYDAYMDMFFSRESEKSDVVRDNRDILIDIHRYLAWKLQTAAEAGSDGSIERNELRSTLFSYLDREGEDTSIVDGLFDGIIERVGALVSRVQETYEFEVQPLREYFVARFLYETSPYPSTEGETKGDKFDRFNALIRNPYWLNVARFYGGCFNKGEIFTLVSELTELDKSPLYAATSHARTIALMLLGDWVFTQYQPAVKSVVSFISEYPQLRQLLASVEDSGTGLWGILPDRSGRLDFLAILFELIKKTRHSDEVRALAQIINQNTTAWERLERWRDARPSMFFLDWAKLGSALNVYSHMSPKEAETLLASENENDELLVRFVESRCFELVEQIGYGAKAQDLIVTYSRPLNTIADGSSSDILSWLSMICAPTQYGLAFRTSPGMALRHMLEGRTGRGRFPTRSTSPETLKLERFPELKQRAILAYLSFIEQDSEALRETLNPWSELVTALRLAWADNLAFDRIAFLSAGIRSKVDLGSDGDLGPADDIVATARFARLKSGAPQWWMDRLTRTMDARTKVRWLLLLWLWGTPRTLVKISVVLNECLTALSSSDWLYLSREFYVLSPLINRSDDTSIVDSTELSKLSSRACSFVGQRLPTLLRSKLAHSVAQNSSAEAPEIQFAMEVFIENSNSQDNWEHNMDPIKHLYSRGASFPLSSRQSSHISVKAAKVVARHPESFPLPLISMSDSTLRSEAGSKALGLLAIANRDKWFS